MPTGFNILPPALLNKFKADIEANISASMNQMMATTSQSIVKSINRWALSNSSSINTQVDKALQPFLNSIKQSAISSLGGVSLPSSGTVAAQGGANKSSMLGSSVSPQAMWDTLGKVADNQKSIADSQKQIAAAIAQLSKPTAPAPGATTPAGRHTPSPQAKHGGEIKEGFMISAVTEIVHGVYEKVAEVRNEMYSTLIQGSNLQRQMDYAATGGPNKPADIRDFVKGVTEPGMAQGYTKQEALNAASTLALAGGSRSQAQTTAANEAMVDFAGKRGYDLSEWSQVSGRAETAGLFGGARGTGLGGEDVEQYQSKVAGMFQVANRAGGGSHGTISNLDEFADSITNVASVLTNATGSSEDMVKALHGMGEEQGNVYDIMTRFEQTGNIAVSGQAGVQAIGQMNQAITSSPFGTPGMQSMLASAYPNKTFAQRIVQAGKGLTDPENFNSFMGQVSKIKGKENREAYMMTNMGLSLGVSDAYLKAYSDQNKKGGKITKEELESAASTTATGADSEAIRYRQAIDALTKSAEELAANVAPWISAFDKINGMLLGLPEIAIGLLLFKKGLVESGKGIIEFGKHLLFGRGKDKATTELEKLLGKGKGQPVYITNDCLKICGGGLGGGGGGGKGGGLIQDAEHVGEGVVGSATVAAAKKSNIFGRLFRAQQSDGVIGVAKEFKDIYKEEGGFRGFMKTAFHHGPVELFNRGRGLLGAGWRTAQTTMGHIPGATRLGEGIGNILPRAGRFAASHPGLMRAGGLLSSVAGLIDLPLQAAADAAGVLNVGSRINAISKQGKISNFMSYMRQTGNKDWHFEKDTGFMNLGGSQLVYKTKQGKYSMSINQLDHMKIVDGQIETFNEKSGKWEKIPMQLPPKKPGSPATHHDPAHGGVALTSHQTELARHVRAMAKTRTDHLKAANLEIEHIMTQYLDKSNPIPAQTKAQIKTDTHGFLQDWGSAVGGWAKAAWDWITGGKATSGGSSSSGSGSDSGGQSGFGSTGANSSADSFTAPSGGSGTFVNPFGQGWSRGANWKSDAHVVLADGQEDYERGQIFSSKAGTPITLSQGAKYDASLSDEYRSIFTMPNGQSLSYMHGDMDTSYKEGQYLKAGTQIGTSLAISGAYTSKKGIQYQSYPGQANTGIVEFGVYDNAQDAYVRNVDFDTKSLDPNAYLSQGGIASSNYAATSTGKGGSSYPTSISINSKSQGSNTLTDPKIIKALVDASKATGVPVQVLAAQGFAESGWQANPSGGVPGGGWAQFKPETGEHYGLKSGDRTNPILAIPAEAKMMADKMKVSGGSWSSLSDIDTVLTGYYGTDASSFNNAYQGYSETTPHGGVASPRGRGQGHHGQQGQGQMMRMAPIEIKPEPIRVEIDLKYPDGSYERIVKTAKFQGVAGVHVQHNVHKVTAHHANSRQPRR